MKGMIRLRQRHGQSMTEYALILAFVIAFLYAIRGFFTTHMSGTITAAVNNYETGISGLGTITPYAPGTNSASDSTSDMSYAGTGAVNSVSNAVSDSTSTSTF